jgi:hypothetical protein
VMVVCVEGPHKIFVIKNWRTKRFGKCNCKHVLVIFFVSQLLFCSTKMWRPTLHVIVVFFVLCKCKFSKIYIIKDNVVKLHDTFVWFCAFFWHKFCWRHLVFMTYFSHFSSSILTFLCLFSTIKISRIIATISRWSTIESCGPRFWNVSGHVAWRLEMIDSPTPIRKV